MSQLTVVQCRPNSKVLALLNKATAYCVDGPATVDDFVTSLVFGIYNGDDLIGAFSCEPIKLIENDSLNVVAVGAVPGNPVLHKIVSFMKDAAILCGAKFISCHTKRPGLSKVLTEKHGFTKNGNLHYLAVKHG